MSATKPPDHSFNAQPPRSSASNHQIEKFTGEPAKFVDFWKQFATIHQNNSLANIRKFCYLRALLKGEALSIISGLQVNNENYDVAINLLFQTYSYNQDTEYAILFAKLEQISLNEVTLSETKRVVNDMESVLAEMEAIGENIADPILQGMYVDRLPKCLQCHEAEVDSFAEFRKLVNEKLNEQVFEEVKPEPTFELLPPGIDVKLGSEPLQYRIPEAENHYQVPYVNAMPNMGPFPCSRPYPTDVYANGQPNFNVFDRATPLSPLGDHYEPAYRHEIPSDNAFDSPEPSPFVEEKLNDEVNFESEEPLPVKNDCVFCGGHPNSEDCQAIPNADDRKDFIAKRNLCLRCLGDGHYIHHCPRNEGCRNCGKTGHHTALCSKYSTKKGTNSAPTSYAASVKENISPKDRETTVQSLWTQFDATALTDGKLLDTDAAVQRMEAILPQLQALGEDVTTSDVRDRYIARLPPWITNNKLLVQKQFTFIVIRDKVKKHLQRLMTNRERQLGNNTAKSESVGSTDSELCVYCDEPHSCIECDAITDTKERHKFLTNSGRCIICLKSHKSKDCTDKKECASCGKENHHSSVCFFLHKNKVFKKNKTSTHFESTSTISDDTVTQACVFCDTHTNSAECPTVKTKAMRFLTLKRRGLCFLCLQNHKSFDHTEPRVPCIYCNSKGHHASLCYRNPNLEADETNCLFCQKHQFSSDCTEVTDIDERKELIAMLGRCKRCLNKHKTECTYVKECRFCKASDHHRALCEKNPYVLAAAEKKGERKDGNGASDRVQYRQGRGGNWQFDSDDEYAFGW
uniref:CCHC-type domain-containing protein n=1 Tax=Panagrellus redivivus TaxID=6233 RepID=A0A7E4ZVP3_PANRE